MPDIQHERASQAFAEFLAVMQKLRDPVAGCPWDLKQTFESLRRHLVEEAYEVGDAVQEGPGKVCEELGDLLSVIGLYAQIAADQSLFSFESVVRGITDKLIRRHPHVFGELQVSGTEEVLQNWEKIKLQERANSGQEASKGLLDGIPRSMPALMRAHEIGERTARVGFDWESLSGVAAKVREEVDEFLNEVDGPSKNASFAQPQRERIEDEFGDLLFTLAQQSRHLGFNAEEALTRANAKFTRRFKALEELASQRFGAASLANLQADQLQELWIAAKKQAG